MKNMKKLFSMCLALTVILASFAFAPVQASAWEAHTNDVDLRVGLMSDSHITRDGGAALTAAENALSALKTLGGEKMDGLLFTGDVIYYPSASSDPKDIVPYEKLYGAIEKAGFSKSDLLAYAMGNHEFPQSNVDATVSSDAINTFVAQTGFEVNHHVEKNGFHFIAGGAINYNGTCAADTEAWLKAEIDKAIAADATNDVDGAFADGVIPDSKKPVFLLLHHPIDGTIFNVSGDKYSDDFVAFLKNRPQIINLTAHWHAAAQLPDSIWQDGFTAFQTPLTGGGYLEEVGATSSGNVANVSQGSMMEIADNVVSIYKMDYVTGEYIGMPWIIDIPAIVEDRLDSDASNDKAHMTYSKDKYEGANAPEFPADAELTVQVEGDTAYITYPNNAVMTVSGNGELQDDFTRAYKIDLVAANGTVAKTVTYMADYYRAPANRVASYTKTVSGLNPGMKYTVNVYPVSPLNVLGAALTANIETPALEINESAVRYEFEDYCPSEYSNIVRPSEYASGKKMLYSAYKTAWMDTDSLIGTNDSNGTNSEANDNIPIYFEFKATVPYTCTYDVNFTLGATKSSWISKTTVLIDGVEIGSCADAAVASLAQDGTYPYSGLPMSLFSKKNVELTAGREYTITLKVEEPKVNTTGEGNQPYLFCADYIEFVPKMPILQAKSTTRMEVEDYASDFSIPGTAKNSFNSSQGKYVHWDTEVDANKASAILEIPMQVEVAGPYKVEYIASAVGTNVKMYVDDTQINTSTTLVSTEARPGEGQNYLHFNEYHHSGNKYSFNHNFTEGKHTLKIELTNRGGSNGDVAICLDYFDFTYTGVAIGEDAPLKFGFYENKNNFSPATTVWNHASTYTGQLAYNGGGATTTFTMPLVIKDSGLYEMEFVGAYSSGLSVIKFYLDDTAADPIYTINANNIDYIDLSENKQVYQERNGWLAKQYNFLADLSAGAHTLYVVAESRGSSGVAYAWDYMDIQYYKPSIAKEGTTRLELEKYSTLISIPETDGTDGKAKVSTGAGASEGKYFAIDTSDGLAAINTFSIEVPVHFERGGLYTVEYVGNAGTSPTTMYIDDVDVTTNAVETVLDDQKVDGLIQYFSSSWATAKKYVKNGVLVSGGDHTLVIKLTARKELDFARYLDYIQFKMVDTFTVKAEGKSVAEFENYSSGTITDAAPLASGGLMTANSYTSVRPTIQIPVKIEKSGYYDVSYIASNIGANRTENANHDYLSTITLKIGNTVIGNNKGNAVENLGHIYDVFWPTAPGSLFETKGLYLEAGEYDIVVTVDQTADKQYKYILDNIVFTPVDSFNVENGVATAKVTFDETVNGTAMIAIYNGNQLVSVGEAPVVNADNATVTALVSGEYTHAKVLVWEDLTNIVPVVKPIELNS